MGIETALVLGSTALAGNVAGGAMQAAGAGQQSDAADAATAESKRQAQQMMETARVSAVPGIKSGAYGGMDLQDFYNLQSEGALMGGAGAQREDVALGAGIARDELTGGYGAAQAGLGDVLGRVEGTLGYESELAKLRGDPSGYMAQDPGYQFRLKEGEGLINRQASARGGRNSGRTYEELARFGQGLASQEFGAASQRAALQDQMTMQQQGQIAGYQAGLGGQAAMMPAQQGQQLAGLATSTGSQLGGISGNLGSQLANLYGGSGANLGNMLYGQGVASANTLMGAQTNASNMASNAAAGAVPYAGQSVAAAGQGAGNALSGLAQMGAYYAGAQGQPSGPTNMGLTRPQMSLP